jgi:hypothetical protein
LDGSTVFLWDTLTDEEKKTCNKQLEKTKNWVVWCKSSMEIDDMTSAMRQGKVVFELQWAHMKRGRRHKLK